MFTQATVWLAMLAWTMAIVLRGRWFWTAGLAFYFLHILSAYGSHYQWSHEIALKETARQTAEVTGWKSGVGLWFNYAFAAILAFDLAMQWLYRRRKFSRTIDGLIFFMILNGAVVFGSGAVRVYGAVLCIAILVDLVLRVGGNSSPTSFRPR